MRLFYEDGNYGLDFDGEGIIIDLPGGIKAGEALANLTLVRHANFLLTPEQVERDTAAKEK
jgi:hypothetical protein